MTEVIDPLANSQRKPPLAVSIGEPNEPALNTTASQPPNGYYVIIGQGPAAVINHTTLRQSKAGKQRLGDLPVLHIGFADPWSLYHEHGMGHPP